MKNLCMYRLERSERTLISSIIEKNRSCTRGVMCHETHLEAPRGGHTYLYWNPFLRRKMKLGAATHTKYGRARFHYGGRGDFLAQDEHAR